MKELTEVSVLSLEMMSSGHSCLNLSSKVSWEGFSEYAEKILEKLGGVIYKKSDSPDVRVWDVLIQGELLRLVFDDFPTMVSLESKSESGDKVLLSIKALLSE